VFNKIFDLINFIYPDAPLEMNTDIENGLKNPHSKAFCMILWLMSIEPPFYAAISKASKHMSMDHLEYVGPMARVLFEICKNGENNRKDKDSCGLKISEFDPKN